MCGIAGFFGFSGPTRTLDADLLEGMSAALAHRGPDGEGTWISAVDGVGLANRRLAIIDRSAAGAQPMTNEDGTVRVTFNGEIYNHRELRAQLEARGHTFRSHADTEALVHAYEEWGVECFPRLIGMWAVAIWDATRRRLVLSRDRIGIKPLYYLVTNGQIRFASEIKALLVGERVHPDIDLDALSLYLTYMVAPAPRTLFRDVLKLPPAHVLVVEAGRAPRDSLYWDPFTSRNALVEQAAGLPPEQLEDFAIEAVDNLLQQSVKRRLMSDVPVGVFLSGGVDSSTVAALTRQHVSGRLATFSAGYDDPTYRSDLPQAARVARMLECDHQEVVLGEQDLIGSLDHILFHLDEPNACWVSSPIFALAREARRSGVGVILNGEGSDEIFGGYDGYLRATHLARLAANPLWNLVGAPLSQRLLGPLFALAGRVGGRARGTRDDFERLAYGEPAFIGLQIGVTESLKRQVLAHPPTTPRPTAAVIDHIEFARGHQSPIAAGAASGRVDELAWIVYLELKHRLPEMLLTRLDKMTMAHGVEGRVPFVDHELVEFVLALPGSLRTRGGRTKYLLRRVSERWLPRDVVYQPKLSFGAPVARWLRGDLGHHIEQQMNESALVGLGVFRGEVIRRLIADHRTGRADNAQAIWSLYCASRWYDLLVARRPRRESRPTVPRVAGVHKHHRPNLELDPIT